MKKIRLSITVKLLAAFVFLSAIIIFSGIYLFYITKQYKDNIEKEKQSYLPTINLLREINSYTLKTNELILVWVYVEKKRNTSCKNKLDNIANYQIPLLLEKLNERKADIAPSLLSEITILQKEIVDYLNIQREIMFSLETVDDYSDSTKMFRIKQNFGSEKSFNKLSEDISSRITGLQNVLNRVLTNDQDRLLELYSETKKMLIIRLVILSTLFIVIIYLIISRIIIPVKKIRQNLTKLRRGILDILPVKVQYDEIGDIAENVSILSENLKEVANFSKELGQGNFDVNYEPLSEDDILGNSILTTKDNLQEAETERKINEEKERQYNWHANGLAKFSDILRKHGNNLQDISYIIINELVSYLDLRIGGFFLFNGNDESSGEGYLELAAAYAYDKEHLDKKILPGENLVGQCFKEKETILVTDVPQNYITINSGLGQEYPKAIMLVPLKYNEKVYGVIELASFSVFESYKINFVEKIAESTANTIANLKINENTKKLLNESQDMADQLASQEEEMRQTLEEMEATHEELETKSLKDLEEQKKIQNNLRSEINKLKSEIAVKNRQLEKQKKAFENKNNELDILKNAKKGD